MIARGGKIGGPKIPASGANPVLKQRFPDSHRDDHRPGRNLPKAAADLGSTPITAEEEKQTTAKAGGVAAKERAGLSLLPGRQRKRKGSKA